MRARDLRTMVLSASVDALEAASPDGVPLGQVLRIMPSADVAPQDAETVAFRFNAVGVDAWTEKAGRPAGLSVHIKMSEVQKEIKTRLSIKVARHLAETGKLAT